jgi:hypothetical protein
MACAKCAEQFGRESLKKCEESAITFHICPTSIHFLKVQFVTKSLTCPRGKSLLVECRPLDDKIVPGPITANVGVCAVVAYRSRVLSTCAKLNKINILQINSSRHHCANILLWLVRHVPHLNKKLFSTFVTLHSSCPQIEYSFP